MTEFFLRPSARLAKCRSRVPVLGDVRDLSRFPDKVFGAATCFHVLEHLPTAQDAENALAELCRVADIVFVCSPSFIQPVAHLHSDHHLWVWHQPDGTLLFQERSPGPVDTEYLYSLFRGSLGK